MSTKKIKICVVGAGHVGLVAAACFAQLGNKVVCVDNDRKKITTLKKGKMPFFEPELAPLVRKNLKRKTLTFSSSLDQSVKNSQVIFLAVGTPPQPDGSADLASIENVAQVIARNLNSYKLIVEKSTVPVQTGQKVKETIYRYRKGTVSFDVASNPEFLREGKAVYDFFNPDRIVLGVESDRAQKLLRKVYASLKSPIVVTDISTAELIKHASNSFLATKISFINAVAQICDRAGADVSKVAEGMGFDQRIGKAFLNAGIGYGGFCFPKDLEAFLYISKKLGYNFSLLQAVKDINDYQCPWFVDKVKEHLWILKGKKIALLGLSFKPDTDDMRFAPSLGIVDLLLKEGAHVSLYDPQGMPEARALISSGKRKRSVTFAKGAYEAVKQADCVCFLTEWEAFKKLNLRKIKTLMNYPLIADGRNMFDPNSVTKLGFHYIGVGR